MALDLTTVELGDDSCRVHARGKFSDKDANDYIPNPESNKLQVDVPLFEGPFDLLLHLIKKHSMDIFDIPIVVITKSYLEALDEMQTLDLDLAGEFLLMAATLMQIKSKMLLPPDEQAALAGDDESAVDPRAELVRRLIEYQKFKEAAADLAIRNQVGADSFPRGSDDFSFGLVLDQPDESGSVPLVSVEVFELIELFASALDKSKPKFAHSVQFEKVSVRARMTELIEFSRLRSNFNFMDLLQYFRVASKIDVIVTFLAVLEMAKLKLITIDQDFQSKTIQLSAVTDNLWDDLTDLPGEIV